MRRRSPWTAPAPRTRKTALHLLTQNSPSPHPTPQLPSNPHPLPSQMAGGRPSPTGLPACPPSPTWTTTTWSWVDPWGGAPPMRVLPLQPTTTAITPQPAILLDHPRLAPAADTLWTRRRWFHVPAAASPAFASPQCVSELHRVETPTRTWMGTTRPHVGCFVQDPRAYRPLQHPQPPPPAWSRDSPCRGRRHKP